MEIERLPWWVWVLISIPLGIFLAYMNSGPIEPTGMRTDRQTDFERAVLTAPVGSAHIPWIQNIVVYPVTEAISGDSTIPVMPITYEVLVPKKDGQPGEYEYQLTWFRAPVPYPPSNTRVMVNDDYGPVQTPALPPGMEKTYAPEDNATLQTITAAVYGNFTPEGGAAISMANPVLKYLKVKEPVQHLIDAGRFRAGQELLIPWNPAKQLTVRDWLDSAKRDYGWVGYRFAWWKVPKYCNLVWIGSTFAVVGVLWPITMNLILGAGLGGRAGKAEDYDLSRFGSSPSKAAAPRPSRKAELDEEGQAKLAELTASLTASVGAAAMTAAAQPAQPVSAAAPAPAKTLVIGPAEPQVPVPPPLPGDPREYTGEFYPVARPSDKPNEPPKHA